MDMASSPPGKHPAIQAAGSDTLRQPSHIPIASAYAQNTAIPTAPMSVPHSTKKSPPPPLPPPRYIETKPELVHRPFGADNEQLGTGPIKSGSSLTGGGAGSAKQFKGQRKNIDFGIEESDRNTRGEGEGGGGGGANGGEDISHEGTPADPKIPDLSQVVEYNKLQGENTMGQRSNERSSAAYDKQVLARIGGPSTPPRSAGAVSSSATGEHDPASPKSFRDFVGPLRPLSIGEHRRSDAAESPRWPPALSPSFQNLHSPLSETSDPGRSWSRSGPSHNPNPSSEAPLRSPHDSLGLAMSVEPDSAVVDEAHATDLNPNDKRPLSNDDSKTGQKRRAQSPPNLDPSLRGPDDSQRRGNAPVARIHAQDPSSQPSSVPSTVQSGSYQSSYGFSAGSSATSYSSQHPLSSLPEQHEAQPATPQESSGVQVLGGQVLAQHSQPNPMGPPLPHRRAGSTGIARPPGVFICECCPKKPKKFDNEEELRVHEMEKQYFCQFCHNRFKNKNEAERHQNSLHLRRHSWSCAALHSLEDAFHPTTSSAMTPAVAAAHTPNNPVARFPSNTDTCGYCGQEFGNPPDWNDRVAHLNTLHKFGECNQSKKFYRADHFRQHLKHSHAGTSGRWTNMLENACMREEPPPQPPPQMPLGLPTAAPMQGVPIPHMPQAPQMQAPMQAAPPPGQIQPNLPRSPPQQAPPPGQIIPPNIGGAPNAPMTEEQAQQTAQQATQEANNQQTVGTSSQSPPDQQQQIPQGQEMTAQP